MTAARVRWETGPTGNLLGRVGTLPAWSFQIFPSGDPAEGFKLVPNLPGTGTPIARSLDLDELKAEAEGWLVGFIAAAGARFPQPATTGETPVPDEPAPPCSPLTAQRGTTAWTAKLQWSLVSGDFIVARYGSGGSLGRPAELTVRRAGRDQCCIDCGHTIARGSLHGVSRTGLIHYCSCCVTASEPETQFIPGRRAAA